MTRLLAAIVRDGACRTPEPSPVDGGGREGERPIFAGPPWDDALAEGDVAADTLLGLRAPSRFFRADRGAVRTRRVEEAPSRRASSGRQHTTVSDANASKSTSRSRRKSAAAVAAVAVLVAAGSSPAQPRGTAPIPTLPLSVTVAVAASADGASADGAGARGRAGPVVDGAWIEAQIQNANTIFEPHGVSFRVTRRARMDARHARLESRADRHALGALLTERVIDCFIVLSLRDVDEPSRYRQGVHWRPRGEAYPAGAHLVIVSSIAGPTVLAHELGHYFGNGHSDVPGNIMSYERGDVPPFFDDAQAARIRSSARRFLRRGDLVAADALAAPE